MPYFLGSKKKKDRVGRLYWRGGQLSQGIRCTSSLMDSISLFFITLHLENDGHCERKVNFGQKAPIDCLVYDNLKI